MGKCCGSCKKSVNGKDVVVCAMCGGAFDLGCAKISKVLFDEIHKSNTKVNKQCFNWTCSSCADKQIVISSQSSTSKTNSADSLASQSTSMQSDTFSMETAMNDFINKFDKKIDELLENKLKPQIDMLNAKIVALEEKLTAHVPDRSNAKLAELEEKLISLEAQLSNIKKSNDDRQIDSHRLERKKKFIIYGIPNENTLDIKSIATATCRKYAADFDADCMSCAKLKVKDDSTTAPILCSFTSKAVRDRIFFGYIKKRDLKLADVMDSAGIDVRLYLNENLTKDEAEIVRECRKLKREKKIATHYLRDGDIFVAVTNVKKSAKQINSMDELKAMIGNVQERNTEDAT